MNDEAMRATLRVTKALADRQRLRILMMLRGGEFCVCQIVDVLRLAPSTVSKHLAILDNAGLVVSRKDGRWAYYRRTAGATGQLVRPIMNWLDMSLANDAAIKQDARKIKTAAARTCKYSCDGPRKYLVRKG